MEYGVKEMCQWANSDAGHRKVRNFYVCIYSVETQSIVCVHCVCTHVCIHILQINARIYSCTIGEFLWKQPKARIIK